MTKSSQSSKAKSTHNPERRSFFSRIVVYLMAGGLAVSYGTFFSFAARFLYPSKRHQRGWLYVAEISRVKEGDSFSYESPDGSKVAVARQGNAGDVSDFVALSSTCPHLGCQVHWESQNDRFFCPCHNGVFDPSGKAVSGPPADAKQSLSAYPLKIERGMLFIEVPLEKLESYRRALRPAGGFQGTPSGQVTKLIPGGH